MDPNVDSILYSKARTLAAGEGDVSDKMAVDMDLSEDSPYPEVRAAVSNVDDPNIPCVGPSRQTLTC
jgi:hypothetical protein